MDAMEVIQPAQLLANVLVAITVIVTGCIVIATLSYSMDCAVYCCTTWATHKRDERDDEEFKTSRETIVHNLGPGVRITCNAVGDESSESSESEEDDAITEPHKSK
jgi:hypothetical protein